MTPSARGTNGPYNLFAATGLSWLFVLVIALATQVVLPAGAQDDADPDAPLPSVEISDLKTNELQESVSDLPVLKDMLPRTAAQILHDQPEDWLIVATDHVLRVKPVLPRPNTLEAMKTKVDKFAATKPQTTDPAKVAAWREEFEKTYDIEVTLIDDVKGQDYWLNISEVDDIIHHETHALREAARLRDAQQFSVATELLEHVRRRDAAWPGLEEETNKLLFAEATSMLRNGNGEHALATLDRLYERDPEFANLDVRFGQAIRVLGREALNAKDPRRTRYFESRLRQNYPKHGVLKDLDDDRKEQARALVSEARGSRSFRDASELVSDAARYAPDLPGLAEAHSSLFGRYPVLHAGTLELAQPAANPMLAGAAHLRRKRLVSATLFEPTAVEGDIVRYTSRFVESWHPEDLERRAVFDLVETNGQFDVYQLAEILSGQINTGSRHGDRWYSAIRSVLPKSPTRLELTLGRGPLRLDALLGLLPVPLDAQFVSAESPAETDSGGRPLIAFRNTQPQSTRPAGQFAEVIEHKYASAEDFGRGIRRDEIAVAVDVPPYLVSRLTTEKWFAREVILGKSTLPLTHMLQFRVGSAVAESAPLRIALERAIDRETVLASAVLHNESRNGLGSEYARVTANLFPSFSYGNNKSVQVRPYDPSAALPMALLARRQLGDRWGTMRLIAPDQAEVRDAAKQLVAGWRSMGMPVELVPQTETEASIASNNWDIIYRVCAVTEPSIELWTLLADEGRSDLEGISYLPEPLRERLIRLDNTRDWPTASSLLADCHRAILEHAILIPLWEVDRLSIRRRSIRGVPEQSLSPYYDLTDWRVEPVFSTSVD